MLFAAPGYLLGPLLAGPPCRWHERVAVVTGLSLCVPILGGLLAVRRWGAAASGQLAWPAGRSDPGRRPRAVRAAAQRPGSALQPTRSEGWRPPLRHVAAFGAAAVIAVCAVGLARAGAAMQHYPGFTQLWLAHPDKNAPTADLGVGNDEGGTIRYRVVLLRNGHALPPGTSPSPMARPGISRLLYRPLHHRGRLVSAAGPCPPLP